MTKQYFELHITLEEPQERRALAESAVELLNWKFSAIDGDPHLGSGVKMYGTTHINTRVPMEAVIDRLDSAAAELIKLGLNVVRKKVEVVIHDHRKGRDFQ